MIRKQVCKCKKKESTGFIKAGQRGPKGVMTSLRMALVAVAVVAAAVVVVVVVCGSTIFSMARSECHPLALRGSLGHFVFFGCPAGYFSGGKQRKTHIMPFFSGSNDLTFTVLQCTASNMLTRPLLNKYASWVNHKVKRWHKKKERKKKEGAQNNNASTHPCFFRVFCWFFQGSWGSFSTNFYGLENGSSFLSNIQTLKDRSSPAKSIIYTILVSRNQNNPTMLNSDMRRIQHSPFTFWQVNYDHQLKQLTCTNKSKYTLPLCKV